MRWSPPYRGGRRPIHIDGFGSAATPQFFAGLEEAGGPLLRLQSGSYGRKYLLRNHQKLIIVPTSGSRSSAARTSKTAYMADSGPLHWRDAWLTVEGPEAAVAGRYFDALFRWSTRKNASLRSLRRIVARHSEPKRAAVEVQRAVEPAQQLVAKHRRDIGGASRLDMIFAYFAPPAAMVRRLGKARSPRSRPDNHRREIRQ
jgi:cardiolipin synthase A/B